ncbi:MAG: DnaJ domain-containing protein [Myxococcales bacterium]
MDTFELLPSLAQGDLRETSAAELVAAVFRARASGTLSVEGADTGEIRTFFRAGDMSGTGLFAGFHTLAHVLLANEWLDAVAIDESREEAARTGRRHGEVLIATGLLTPEQLRAALLVQHGENLAAFLRLSAGTYEWRGWEPPPVWAREIIVDPIAAIVDAMARPTLLSRRRRIVDWLGSHVLRLNAEWPEIEAKSALRDEERQALATLAEPRSFTEFARGCRLPKERVEALIAALLLCGGVDAGEPTSKQEQAAPPPARSKPGPPVGLTELDLDLPEADEPLELDFNDRPTARFDPMEEQAGGPIRTPVAASPIRTPIGAPRLPTPVASPPAPARIPTPVPTPTQVMAIPTPVPTGGEAIDAPLDPELPPDPQAEDRARDLRRKMRERGMRNLGVVMNREVEGGTRVSTPKASTPVNPYAMDAETRSFIDEVRIRAARLDRSNAYERLSISPSASQEHIRQAYITAAKRFHPDRAAGNPALAAVLPQLQALFAALKEAHDHISTPEARKLYDERIRGASAKSAGSRKEEAALALKMGDVLFKKRDFEAAIVKLRRAVELDPTGDSLAALAWALTNDPKSPPAAKEEALALIPKALRSEGTTARTYYVAGVLYRSKDPKGSAECFRKAVELDPSHADASLELRLLEMRHGKHTPKGSGVLSGMLGKRKP